MKVNSFAILMLFIVFSFGCSRKTSMVDKGAWHTIVIDKDLTSFTKLNGTAEYFVKNNEIVGVSKTGTPNTFLCTKEKYGDFILEFKVWADPDLNSGVQFRSISDKDIMNGRVHGYQVEIESSPRKWAGGIYEEGKRGWLYSLDSNPEAKEAFQVGKWNHYRIEAIGNEIVTWVNEIQCTHLIDDMTASGFIGLQVHSIENKEQENKQIKWKDLRIKTSGLESELWPRSSKVTMVSKKVKS